MLTKFFAAGLTVLTVGASALGFTTVTASEKTYAVIKKDVVEYVDEADISIDDNAIKYDLTSAEKKDAVEYVEEVSVSDNDTTKQNLSTADIVDNALSDQSKALKKELEELRIEKKALEKEKAELEAAQKPNVTQKLHSRRTDSDTNENWDWDSNSNSRYGRDCCRYRNNY